jgi:hypothetical protein
LPLLVICEKGLHEDGLLEGKYDWKVFWTDFQPEELRSDRFSGYVQSWKRLVDEQIESAGKLKPVDVDVSKLGVAKLMSLITVPQLWALLATMASVLAAIAAAAFKLGGGKWPWE